MKFKAESELVQVLKQRLSNISSRSNIGIFEEVSLGYGIADLVVCDFAMPMSKVQSFEIPLNHSDANIYNIIQLKRIVSFIELIETTRCSKKAVSDSLKKLINYKYIKQIDNSYAVKRKYELPFRNNFAIETKLKDWKRALYQAYRYKWFAEFAYVVMDEHYAEPAIQNLDLFIRYNVGFATISTNGNLIRYFNPKRNKPHDPIMQIFLQK